MVMKVGHKGGVSEKPVRESGGFDSVFICSVLIDNSVVVNKYSVMLIDEGGGEHVGGRVISSINPGSGVVRTPCFLVGEAITPAWIRVRSGVDEVVG